ncbi:MAG TPA: CRISPR-associated protein Cas4 [Lichenihabitans sp.]|jgi:CRISPR-associated exonuclease Cas4|nr:CRISPR-associated protein Cas4 [Lichenihabitans sp.]
MMDPIILPLSALQHAVYCLRQAALIHVERLWEENRLTAEGQVVHLAAHEPGLRRMKGLRRVTALPLACKRLGLAGTADLVEFIAGPDGETPFPVEYKRGKPKKHRADEVQLCAQALCLEEMTGRPVPEGALFYAEPKRRTLVAFDAELRALTEETAHALRTIVESGTTPPARYKASLCRACSLIELCRPQAPRAAKAWREGALEALLAQAPSVGAPP